MLYVSNNHFSSASTQLFQSRVWIYFEKDSQIRTFLLNYKTEFITVAKVSWHSFGRGNHAHDLPDSRQWPYVPHFCSNGALLRAGFRCHRCGWEFQFSNCPNMPLPGTNLSDDMLAGRLLERVRSETWTRGGCDGVVPGSVRGRDAFM